MGLVRRVHPITVANPERTRTVRFAIDDQFLRFWFTFVQPFESRLHSRADARRHLEQRVLPRLDDYVSRPAFEQVCHGWLERNVPDAVAAGWWWGSIRERGPTGPRPRNAAREVDGAAVDADGMVVALASCKWTAAPLPYGELAALRELAPVVTGHSEATPLLVLFSRSGFDRKLVDEAAADPGVRLLGLEDLWP
jgi:hypothetical protein